MNIHSFILSAWPPDHGMAACALAKHTAWLPAAKVCIRKHTPLSPYPPYNATLKHMRIYAFMKKQFKRS
jgi:hypothetical protein